MCYLPVFPVGSRDLRGKQDYDRKKLNSLFRCLQDEVSGKERTQQKKKERFQTQV